MTLNQADPVQIADPGEHPPAIDLDEAGLDGILGRGDPLHHRRHGLPVLGAVQQVENRLFRSDVLGQAVEIDLPGIPMRLDGAGPVDEDTFDPGLVHVDHFQDEAGQVDTGADHPDRAAVAQHLAVDPDLGHRKVVVMVDIQLADLGAGDGGEVPAVPRVVACHAVAQLAAGIAVVAVVEIVVARRVGDEEVAAIAEGRAVVLQFRQATGPQAGVGLVHRPVQDDGGARKGFRQRRLPPQVSSPR